MKFGVCALIKNENLYLREWVEHYLKLGFDNINKKRKLIFKRVGRTLS